MNMRRIILSSLALLAALALLGSGYAWGLASGERTAKIIAVEGVKNVSNENEVVDFGLFWEAWDTIRGNYLNDASVQNEEKLYGAISGLVRSLEDPYSEFFPPEDNKQFQEDIQGNFGGIGAEIGIRNNRLVVVAPLKDAPAMRAGLISGDWIVEVDATSTDGMQVHDAVQIIRGPVGSEVTLTVFREGWGETRKIAITRDVIVIPTLDLELKESVAHVRLYSFNGNTLPLFHEAVLEALEGGARGMVLDLRNNPGGYLQVAVNLAGWFLPRGTLVVSEQGREGITDRLYANNNASLVHFPLVILVNEGSASASEILAGALRDQRDIPLVGARTFGKGSIQRLEELRNGSSLKLTTAKWVLPSGTILEGEGLLPDVEVAITENDRKEEKDPQLEKALEIVKEKIDAQEGGQLYIIGF